MNKVRVWDLPTRVFHWSLVLCFMALIVTGEMGDAAMVWHFRLGYATLSLLLFRLVWGVIGGVWSRFASFVVRPSTILRYVRGHGTARHSVGHNPLGSLSVLALLGLALLQVATGLFSDDEIATSGPLAKMASSAWVSYATYYHSKVGKVILIVLVQLHIAAIIFYRFRHGQNLVKPMWNGDKETVEPFEGSRDTATTRTVALIVWSACIGAVTALLQWAQ